MKGFNSKLIHGSINQDRSKKDIYGALKTPIYDTVAFEFESSEQIEDAFLGKFITHSYSRITNPTLAALEERLADISGAAGCLALSSGMAAISNTLISICSYGDNIITTKYLFGNTYSLLVKTLKPFGVDTKFIDLDNYDEIKKNIDKNTRAIFLENITNPHLFVYDIENISKIAEENNILLIVDNSLLTPYLFKSVDFGVDIEIISTTKSISGGATAVGGSILVYQSEKWNNIPKLKDDYSKYGKEVLLKKLKKEVYRNLGSCLSPQNAYLQLLGLETLTLRIDRSCDNAIKLCDLLSKNKNISNINYPASKTSKYYSLVKKQFNGKSGCLMLFELKSREECFKFMNNLKMIKRATNFCDNKSLIIHPSSTIFCEFSHEEKLSMGVNDNMLRLSVGIEDIEDIIGDIEQALK